MKFTSPLIRGGLAVSTLCLLVLLAGWTDNPQQKTGLYNQNQTDTIPKKQGNTEKATEKDLDKALRELERAQESLMQLQKKDFEKMQQEIESSLKKIDLEKIKQDVERSLKQIDLEKIQREIQQSLSKIDFEKMELEVEKALKEAEIKINEVDFKKELEKAKEEINKAKEEVKRELKNQDWKKELEKEMKKINEVELKKEFEAAKKEIEKAKLEFELEKKNIGKELEKARAEIEVSKEALRGYQKMIYQMEAENLLDTKTDYTIDYENGEIKVNGKKLSPDQSEKYKQYFKKDKVTIHKKDGEVKVGLD